MPLLNRISAVRSNLMLLALLCSLPFGIAQAGIISSEQDAGTTGGSRMRNDDRILIWPDAVSAPGGTLSPNIQQCVSLYNRTMVDYFVPWKSNAEWNSFLTARANGQLNTPNGTVDAARCCAPAVVEVCGVQVPAVNGQPPELDTNLGQRIVAARNTPGDPTALEKFGATLDVKSLQSTIILNDNLINYEVTYMCNSDGSWVKTRELGSCVPIDGACNAQYTTTPIDALPPEAQWSTTLCAQGSILHDPSGTGAGPFVTGTGPWTWQCDGTPGRAPSICSASYDGCTAEIPVEGFRNLPPVGELCKPGNTAINIAPLVGNGPWDWECQKNDNGHISTCHAAFDATIDGICNPAVTGALQAVVPLVKTNLCLGADGMTPIDATADATCDNQSCTWTCPGSNGGSNTSCTAYRQQAPGACGSLAGTTPIHQPNDNDPNLCSVGTPTPVSGTEHGPTWNWSCVGAPDPVSTDCEAPNEEGEINGVCGAAAGTLYTSPTPPNLGDPNMCASGTPHNLQSVDMGGGVTQWSWECRGDHGGSDDTCSADQMIGFVGSACGSAHLSNFASQPVAGLCVTGNTATPLVDITVPYVGWSWTCDDTLFPGNPVNCIARSTNQPINGSCGTAQGQNYGNLASPPGASALCANGGSVLSFNWPSNPAVPALVTWGCGGQNGGTDTGPMACFASYVPATDGQCGPATAWTPNALSVISSAPAFQLCQPTGQSFPSNFAANYNAVNPALSTITWTCSRVSLTGQPANCSAAFVPTPRNGVCGVIPDSFATRPADGVLCTTGVPQNWVPPVAGSGPGTATWQCNGLFGGANTNCSQAGVEHVNPTGQCGQANGAYVPDRPNYNLCAPGGGNASAVSGDGPWSWTCGVAAVSCQAFPCTLCSGTLPSGLSNQTVGSPTIKTMGSCQVSGRPIWTASAALQLSNDVPVNLSWTDNFNGPVSVNITPVPAPNQYCAPCFMRPLNLNAAATGAVVEKVSGGVCPHGITTTPSILTGTGASP